MGQARISSSLAVLVETVPVGVELTKESEKGMKLTRGRGGGQEGQFDSTLPWPRVQARWCADPVGEEL